MSRVTVVIDAFPLNVPLGVSENRSKRKGSRFIACVCVYVCVCVWFLFALFAFIGVAKNMVGKKG